MDLVDEKYIGFLSSRLEKFKKVKPNLYNFRCPLCGDSKKSKSKTRGYLYQVKINTNFKCHNCGASMSFNNFLKQMDVVLHKKYKLEKFKDGFTGKNFVVEEPEIIFEKPVFSTKILLPLCSGVRSAKRYLESRRLDATKFYYAEKFKEFVRTYIKDYAEGEISYDEPRIIIPLYQDKKLIGFQGRSLGPNKLKYITIMLDEKSPKIYGLDTIDKKSTVYVVEGPFDSCFLSNSVALCGSDGDMAYFQGINIVFVYDNEPRNREIVSRIERCISRGEGVVIWPDNIKEKDINDMVLSGLDVQSVVESNVYYGLEANLKFNNWKRA